LKIAVHNEKELLSTLPIPRMNYIAEPVIVSKKDRNIYITVTTIYNNDLLE
jgi:hypothetical protein